MYAKQSSAWGRRAAARLRSVVRVVAPIAVLFGALLLGGGIRKVRAHDVRINEVLASNRLAAVDEDGSSPDWIELINIGSEAVDLAGYAVSNDGLVPDKWVFPSVTLPAGGFLLVWCSGNDRAVPGDGVDPPILHTSFRLDDDGGIVTLRASDGRHLGDAVYLEQAPDQSWARSPDGDGAFRYHLEPTPGAPNRGPVSASSLVVADTTFTVDRGFFDEPFDVILRTATPQATIRFTIDGTVPTLANGATYRFPVRIDRTTVLRAAAFRDGFRPSNVDTQTYLFLDDIVRQDAAAVIEAGFPERWGGFTADYGFDPRVIGEDDEFGGKYRESIRDDLLAVPTMSLVLPIEDMFGPEGIYTRSHLTGPTAERAVSVELIYPNGDEGFQEDCGLRIHGGAFREHTRTKKHSLRLLFKRIYGTPKLRYPLFGLEAAGEFDTIVLRANANDGYQSSDSGSRPLYLRDSYVRETQLALGAASSRGRFVHLYINGIYWGLYNPSERPDDSFSASYFGGEKEEWDSIATGFETHAGDLAAWDEFLRVTAGGFASLDSYMAAQGLHVDGTPNAALEVYLDVENVIDYMIANLYAGNMDWPQRNFWFGRRRVESSGFKFYAWDSELSLGLGSGVGTNRTEVAGGVAQPYARLRSSPEFRLRFADALHRYFFNGGPLHVDAVDPRWDPERPERNVPAARFVELAETIERAMVAESARWGDQHGTLYTRDEHWAVERDQMLETYFPQRSAVVLEQFRAIGLYPSVAAPSFVEHGGRVPDGFALLIDAPAGEIFYTLDGADPRAIGGAVAPQAVRADPLASLALIGADTPVRYLVPADGALALAWTAPGFDDSAWREAAPPLGFGARHDGVFATDVSGEMLGINASVYVRVAFEVASPERTAFLRLRMKAEDGFIAYLNGARVAAINAPDDPAWNSASTRSRGFRSAQEHLEIPLAGFEGELRAGSNVLALHGMNSAAGDIEFLLAAELDAKDATGRSIPLDDLTRVRARARVGDEWSALNEADFLVSPKPRLAVTEIMYHPRDPRLLDFPADTEAFEYVEIRNVGTEAIDLRGLEVEGGILCDLSRAPDTTLAPDEHLVLVENAAAFRRLYGTPSDIAVVEYEGRLSNSGDTIRLRDRIDRRTLFEFRFEDEWYPETDGRDRSLVLFDALSDPATWSEASSWQPSFRPNGSPGALDEPLPSDGGLHRPGDYDLSGFSELGDVLRLFAMLYQDAPAPCDGPITSPANRAVLDANGDGRIDLSDVLHGFNERMGLGPSHALGIECVAIVGCVDSCGR